MLFENLLKLLPKIIIQNFLENLQLKKQIPNVTGLYLKFS